MSLLNKMLRDLDARHAPSMDRAALPDAVHVQPAERERHWYMAVVALALAAAAGWYFVAKPDEPLPRVAAIVPEPRPVPVAPAPPQPATQAPAVPAAAAPSFPAADSPAPAPKPKAGVTAAPKPEAKPSGTKEKPPADAPASARPAAPPVKDAQQPPAKESKERPVKETKEPPVKETKEPPVKEARQPSAEPSGIEKRPRSLLSGAAAENEYAKAMAALRQGATGAAFDGLRAALRLDSRHVSARQALLSLLMEQQQWGEAEALLEEGLALDPAQSGWALALARLQLENGRFPAAVDTLERYARHAERNADYQAFRALLFQKQKRPAEAAERYRAALALKPAESRWWYGLGLVLEADHKTQEAREAYLKARETGNLPPELAGAVEHRLR